MGLDVEFVDFGGVVDDLLIPGCEGGGVGFEFFGVLCQVSGPASEDFVHGFVLEAGLRGRGGTGG